MVDYKAVIFDFNGTLFFDNDKHIKAWGEISKLLRGHGISEDELHTHINGVPNHKVVSYMLNGKASEADMQKYSNLKEEYYRKFCKEDEEHFHLVKGSEAFFDKLKEKSIPFTIASASIKANIEFFVESFHLDQWIDPSNIIYDDGTYENKVLMFQHAADILHTDIKDTLIIEDSISGIHNAYVAGCSKIIVVDSANKEEEYKKLSGVVEVIKDLTNL